ncbi:uncharacterized protein LOC110821426 [Carica papaya]|uniref:uncharacterized protein LOC110821426 n=1 Tax=Carica papaya TaxID=3649 RepID=UPI000B8CA3A8|nr:uncharacterized protein LOC110821426 [Carica papaya]XP_021906974.1 uncharacterized protein LOC110821426 [Carica papaya]
MVGMRADHLGLHGALCVLIGWKYEVAPNSTWVMRMLPDAELMSLKEDLLIWPPVVVFNNSSIANNCSEKRRVVSIEELGEIVRGMGIARITKLYHGRPANQSVMVVSFQGTLSGLQEAERLHKFYAATEHGRADFQKLSGSGCTDGNKVREPITDMISNVLYGYLGIAEDLEKLDSENRRRSVLKGKNEIEAIVDATPNASLRG